MKALDNAGDFINYCSNSANAKMCYARVEYADADNEGIYYEGCDSNKPDSNDEAIDDAADQQVVNWIVGHRNLSSDATDDAVHQAELALWPCQRQAIQATQTAPTRLAPAQIERDACDHGVVLTDEADRVIESCTALIQSGHETTADLVRDYGFRAGAYLTKHLYDREIADETKVIALAPDDAFNFEMRAGAYILKGLYDQAIADYTKAIALKRDAPDVYYHRGSAYTYKRLYDLAIADYTKAIALKPDDGNYYASRALAYHFKGEDAQGLPDADKAVALLPKYDNVIENRAEIYEKLDRRDDAIADYRAALALNPNDKDAQAGLKRLGAAAVVPAHADVTPGTATFLREIGIDPTSADVASIAKDDANGTNLNSLAANRDAQGVKRFIATRVFLHKFLIDSNTPYPPPDLYDVQYLAKAEQTLIANHIKKEFGVAPDR